MKFLAIVSFMSLNFAMAQAPLPAPAPVPVKIIRETENIRPASDSNVRSTGGGNGGFIAQMRQQELLAARPLTADEIREILMLDGREIKEQLIRPLLRTVTVGDIDDFVAAAIWKMMLSGPVSLEENVNYTRMEEGTCPGAEDMCTSDSPFSTIVFDVENLVSSRSSLADIAGLVLHEFSHHYVGEDDHPRYAIARWFKNKVASGRFGTVTFNLDQLIEKDAFNYTVILKADYFCEYHGFSKLVSSTSTSVLSARDAGFSITRTRHLERTNIPSKPYIWVWSGKHTKDSETIVSQIICQ